METAVDSHRSGEVLDDVHGAVVDLVPPRYVRQEGVIVSRSDDRRLRDTVSSLAETNGSEQSVAEAPFASGCLQRTALCQKDLLGFTRAPIPYVGFAIGVELPQVAQVADPLSRGVGFLVGDGASQSRLP